MKNYDLAIIGGGPGGYVAAIRAAKLGLSVALVEGRELGGTCLNRGCIPSKTMLKHAEVMNQIKAADQFGITVKDLSFSLESMVNRKNQVVNQLLHGIKGLLRKNKIALYQGFGTVGADKCIAVSVGEKKEEIQAENIILANGSKPILPKIHGLDGIKHYTSDTVFDIEEIPGHLVIMGGGVIGLEIACIFESFGTKVEIIEMAERLLPMEDPDIAGSLAEALKKKGIQIHTNSKVTKFVNTSVLFEKDGKQMNVDTDAVLVSVGRIPNKQGIENLDLRMDGRFVKVNENMETSIAGIYAVGDLIGGYQLAHAASKEGIQAVSHIAGEPFKKNLAMPRCIYTFPEAASAGMTEKEARDAGYAVKVHKVSNAGNGKAIAAGENEGFMKIISEEKHGEILGVAMVGPHVTEMISQATAFMHLEGTVEEMESMIFPHPTLSETLFETAAGWLGKAVHG